MTRAVLDDHLLRDLLSDDVSDALADALVDHEPATTSLYLYRLCRSVFSASGGALTGSWTAAQKRALGDRLLRLPDSIELVSIRSLAFRMAEIAGERRLSTLGAEAVAAAEHLGGPLCVWEGDDGPGIRAAMAALNLQYRTIAR